MNVIGSFLLTPDKVGLKRAILSNILQLGLHGTVHRKKNNQRGKCCEVIVSGKRGNVNKLRMILPLEEIQYTEDQGYPSLGNVQLLQSSIA
jgi:acylphosphatase